MADVDDHQLRCARMKRSCCTDLWLDERPDLQRIPDRKMLSTSSPSWSKLTLRIYCLFYNLCSHLQIWSHDEFEHRQINTTALDGKYVELIQSYYILSLSRVSYMFERELDVLNSTERTGRI